MVPRFLKADTRISCRHNFGAPLKQQFLILWVGDQTLITKLVTRSMFLSTLTSLRILQTCV